MIQTLENAGMWGAEGDEVVGGAPVVGGAVGNEGESDPMEGAGDGVREVGGLPV
jgi:hypothetical protein